MKVVILCGGLGTRLGTETTTLPKPMVAIGGRPMLWHVMKIYAQAGQTDFVLCLGYQGEVIRRYFLDYALWTRDFSVRLGSPGRDVTVHDAEPREDWTVTLSDTGAAAQTGDRVAAVRRYLEGSERFCVTYGDGVADIDVRDVLATHQRAGKLATVTAVRPSSRFGELDIEEGMVSSFREKPQVGAGWINGGFFVFERAALDRFPPGVGALEEGVLVSLAREGQLAVHQHEGFWQCMDTVREKQLLEDLWARGDAPWATGWR